MSIDQNLAALKAGADQAKAQGRADRAAENRRRMPQVTAWVDEAREVFGEVSVAYASEGGVTMGQKSPDGFPCLPLGSWARPKKVAKKP